MSKILLETDLKNLDRLTTDKKDDNGKYFQFYIDEIEEVGIDELPYKQVTYKIFSTIKGQFMPFVFTIVFIDDNIYVKHINANGGPGCPNKEVEGKWIPRAILKKVSDKFDKLIYSSATQTTKQKYVGDWLADDGKKVWEQFIANEPERVKFDKIHERYYIIPKSIIII